MGTMKYFGIFKKVDLNALTEPKRKQLLVKKGIWETRFRINLPRDGKMSLVSATADNEVIYVSEIVQEELYGFILKTYQEEIAVNFQDFYYRFNGAIYGLEPGEIKKLALLQFTFNFKKAFDLAVDFTRTEERAPGIQKVENMPKLELMEAKQNALKSNLAESDKLLEFLMGHEAYFKSEAVLDSPIISSLIDFETAFRILKALNFEYNFETPSKLTPEKPVVQVDEEKPLPEDNVPNVNAKEPKADLTEETPIPNDITYEVNIKKPKAEPVFSDDDALAYLMAKVFSKKR
ncbi:hypothetical protein H4O18_16410 [Arenibacter sp. BSSL-BM3]|uniref:Uncharacterized protein n=1 Tax=Arenibacter arenosicollis TaxID=2762274 RepID=A0ABR7QQY6_9FLAO|nr:hypothetical protein [Arenibacter arenosicollis]MBC8769583.1 hypothetical protein [Arenibacter arenosicollis]